MLSKRYQQQLSAYYEELKKEVFGDISSSRMIEMPDTLKVVFILDHLFNYTTPFFINKFLVDLHQLSGTTFHLRQLKGLRDNSAIGLVVVFNSKYDWDGQKLGALLKKDPEYQAFFRRYAVKKTHIYDAARPIIKRTNAAIHNLQTGPA